MERAALALLWLCVALNYATHDELHRKPREPYKLETAKETDPWHA